ncbi:MAG TPA: ABC transporter ATP-binding protein [Lacunisphaera sp.]|jgi:ABC-2 type transport system ATP-binding protein
MNSTATALAPLVVENLTKTYAKHVAINAINLEITAGHVVGLLGRNGAGKTTLLQLAAGLLLPTSGTCRTLGQLTDKLDTPELSRLGLVLQEGKFIEWMTAAQHLEFTASFYHTWDHDLQKRVTEILELPLDKKIAHLSTGDRQKVGILLGVCHRPELLLLDEPISSLDPIARASMLNVLLELLRDDGCTVLISSHILNDVEKILDWVVALDAGQVTENTAFDDLQESFAEWTVTAGAHALPAKFTEPSILAQQGNERLARLTVRTNDPETATQFATTHGVELSRRPLNLEEMFPFLISQNKSLR